MTVKIYSLDSMKMAAVSSFPDEAWVSTSGDKDTGVEELAKRVSWLYAVQHKRAGVASGLPVELQRSGEKVDKKDWPIKVDMPDLIYRYSLATDLYGENYLFKVKRGQTVERIKWFDPGTITIEENAQQGLVGFTRRIGGAPQMYPVKDGMCDVMWTWLPGLVEIGPGAPPTGTVEEEAKILKYMNLTTSGFFERGAVDNFAIFDDSLFGLADSDRKRFRSNWNRMFRGGFRKIGEILFMRSNARLERVSSPIGEWVLTELNDMEAEKIAIAHDTPLMLLRPNEGADKAMMEQTRLMWINEVIIPHAQRMLDTLNEQLYEDMGYEWVINAESMNVNQEEEVLKQQAYSGYVASGMPEETAAAMLGLDVPEDMPLVKDEPEPEEEESESVTDEFNRMLAEQEGKSVEASQFRRWYKKRGADADISKFNGEVLTYLDKLGIVAEVNRDANVHDWRNYP